MKNLFTKIVCLALMCNFTAEMTASNDFNSHYFAELAACPTLDDVVFPPDLALSDDTITIDNINLTPENLVANYGFSDAEANPTWEDPDECENLEYVYTDLVLTTVEANIKILRSWNVVDFLENGTTEFTQVIDINIPPDAYCNQVVYADSDTGTCSAVFSLDACLVPGFNYENLSSDPVDGTILDLGLTVVTISGTVEGNDFECQTVYKVIDDKSPLAIVVSEINIELDPTTCTAQITPEMIDAGSYDPECTDVTMTVSPSQLTIFDTDATKIITLTVTDGQGNESWSFTTATVTGCGSSSGALQCIGLTTAGPLNDDGLQFYPEDFINSDSSDDLSLTLVDEDGNIIPNSYLPINSYGIYTYTVTDNSTNEICSGTLSIPLPYLPCTFLSCQSTVNIILPENGELYVEPTDFSFGIADCENITIDIADIDGNIIVSGANPLITEAGNYYYTVNNEEGNSCWGVLVVSDYVQCPSNLACNANITMQIGVSGFVTISSDDLLAGDYSGCDLNSFTIEIEGTSTTGSDYSGLGLVEIDQAGSYTYTITDSATNNSCWGNLNVLEESDCEILSDVVFPADINLALNILNGNNLYHYLSPENLVSVLGYAENEANATWPVICNNMFSTYTDVIIDLGGGSYKIIRTWTVLDWYTAEIIEGVQIIENILSPTLICDFLPNSAPLGDCDSGHTADDDVEWPDDLVTVDFRIKPSELVTFSMIDPADTQPVMVNNPDNYSLDYIDILAELQQNKIIINRVWTVESGGQVVGTYSQQIDVNIANFSSLVSVQTMFNRPIPEVDLNNDVITNQVGIAYLDEEGDIFLSRDDDPSNGLTIRDLVWIQQYILGLREFSDYQLMAADYSFDQSISAIDLLQLRKAILEVQNGINPDWFFVDNSDQVQSTFVPRGSFIGIKPGDVDDDAYLGSSIFTESGIMLLSDVVINNGETYETTLQYEGQDLSLGVEAHLYYDAELIDVTELFVENQDMTLEYNIDVPGEIHLTLNQVSIAGFLFAGENLINIKFTAKSNGLLSQAVIETTPRNSYLLGLDYELVRLVVEMDGVISSGIESTTEHSDLFKVYPNPVSDVINIEFLNEAPSDFTIQLHDATGRLISEYQNASTIDVNNLNSGIYIYRLTEGTKSYSGHLSVIK